MSIVKKRKQNIEKCYAVTHTSPKGGATHISISLANYISSVLGYEVIYIEMAEKSRLINLVKGKSCLRENSICYKYKKVDYIVSATEEEVRKIILSANCYIVINVQNFAKDKEILNLADKTIIVGDYSYWNEREYIDFVSKNIYKKYDVKKVIFLGNKGIRRKKYFESVFNLEMKKTPYIEDPFFLSFEEIKQIEKII